MMSTQPRPGIPESKALRSVQGTSPSDTIESLELRLIDGYHRIDVAREQGENVSAWEDFWIELLNRYENLCDDVRAAA
jgi:hypothetical protein